MRTTIELDDKIHALLSSICKKQKKTLGQKVEEILIFYLKSGLSFEEKEGVPLLPQRQDALPVDEQMVNQLLEDSSI